MWRPSRSARLWLPLAALAAVPSIYGAAAAVHAHPLEGLESGKWIVKNADGQQRELCLGDPEQLVRLEHPDALCTLDSVDGTAVKRDLQYTCPGHGYGHTAIKIQTPRAVTLDTQGLVDGRPFAYRATARKTGPC